MKLSFYFQKTNLSFREALYQTCREIRLKTKKDLVLPISGGSDSMLVSHVLKDLNIDAKRIHQRYYYRGELLNGTESANVTEVDEYQDIDVEEFQSFSWYQKTFVESFPTPVYMALQPYIKFACKADKEFILLARTPLSIFKFSDKKESYFSYNPQLLYGAVGLKGFDFADVFNENPQIMYSFFDDLYRQQVKEQSSMSWESQFKKLYYEHHFPEIEHMQKSEIFTWNYLKTLNIDRPNGIYMQSGKTQICYPQRTWLNYPLKQFYESIDKSKAIHLQSNWQK